jgi:1-acyl-sn-glycerol-3-phosphate acyltransferase
VGVLPAVPVEAKRLLERGAMVVYFPEGAAARRRSYEHRYALEEFTDAFVVAEAVRARAEILPAAIVGSEESFPVLGRLAGVPLTPVFPLTGVLGLVPLPLGWRVHVDAPIAYGTDDSTGAWQPGDDARLAERLRVRMQSLLNELVRARHSIVRG